MKDLVLIGGAPGSGKSTVAACLQQRLGTPLFEFGWIPEFRCTGTERIGFHEEEELAFENLCLVVENYLRHGFRNIIVTDLSDVRLERMQAAFDGYDSVLCTLLVRDEEQLRRRVLDESRSSAYRDQERAVAINATLRERGARAGERFIEVGTRTAEQVAAEIHSWVEHTTTA